MGITLEDIQGAQKIWGDGVVAIGAAHLGGEDVTAVARNHVDALYGYGLSPVLFKPTKTSAIQFRGTFEGAVSYFVGGNTQYPEDKGFALQPWTAVRFENVESILGDAHAVVMGNYYFTDQQGTETKVEYTFGYIRDDQGRLRINVHHSSLPFGG